MEILKCPQYRALNSGKAEECGTCGASLANAEKVKAASDAEEYSQVEHEKPWFGPGADVLEEDPTKMSPNYDIQWTIAVNVRRIFLVMFLGMVVLAISVLLGLWLTYADVGDPRGAVTMYTVVLLVVLTYGLYYIAKKPRLSE